MTDYLTLPDVLAIHHVMIERYGGSHGVRDMGAVEAAIFRPQSGYYENTLHEAAALMESLAINHPFIDGNKRVAFAATDIFLRNNGYRIIRESRDIHKTMMLWFDKGTFNVESIYTWLKENTQRPT